METEAPNKPSTGLTGNDLLADEGLIEQAFDCYYDLGTGRSLQAVSRQMRIPFPIIKQWHEAYAWDEQIKGINKDLDSALEQHYKEKTKDIRNRLVTQMEALLEEMESNSFGLPMSITTVADLRALAQAYEALVRANVMALTKAADPMHERAPTSWADLLKASGSESEVDLENAKEY